MKGINIFQKGEIFFMDGGGANEMIEEFIRKMKKCFN